MDVRCKVCYEPLDIYEFHDIAGMTFDEAREKFYKEGCGALGFQCEPAEDKERGKIIDELQYLLGDDIDGLASLIEDFDL